jgi:hypothetical protein
MKKLLLTLSIVSLLFACNNGNMSEQTIPEKYRVIYHGNGHTSGEVPVDPKEYEKDETVYLLPPMTDIVTDENGNILSSVKMEKEGYSFLHWDVYRSSDASTVFTGYGLFGIIPKIDSDVEAYAYWTKNPQ